MYLGVLCDSSVKFTIRVSSCVHSIPCDVLNKLYFFIFTKKIVNGLILELQWHVINQSWHNEVSLKCLTSILCTCFSRVPMSYVRFLYEIPYTSSHGVRAYPWILSKYLSVHAFVCLFVHLSPWDHCGNVNIGFFFKFTRYFMNICFCLPHISIPPVVPLFTYVPT